MLTVGSNPNFSFPLWTTTENTQANFDIKFIVSLNTNLAVICVSMIINLFPVKKKKKIWKQLWRNDLIFSAVSWLVITHTFVRLPVICGHHWSDLIVIIWILVKSDWGLGDICKQFRSYNIFRRNLCKGRNHHSGCCGT